MFRFFRKLRFNSMTNIKTLKYIKYAIGEIILVVIGILIALQVNNWNQDRKDRISERKLLDNVHRDFLQNKVSFDSVKVINTKNFEILDRMVALFPIQNDMVKYNQLKAIEKGLTAITYNAYSSSVESLINSNAIELIQDEKLQEYLVSWKDVLLDYKEEEDFNFYFMKENYIPYMLEHIDFTEKNRAMNLTAVSSVQYQNMIIRLRARALGIVNAIKEEPIENHINEILRLTKPEE